MTKLELFQKQYNECVAKEEGWCYICIPEVVMRMNEKYNENYSEEEVENFLFGEIQTEDVKLQFENLGIEI